MSSRKLSEQEEMQLVKEYEQGARVKDLMIKYGYKTKKSIADKVKKYGTEKAIRNNKENRKEYKIDLSEINSEFVAYFIGLMLTDGYVAKDKTMFGIDLADEDVIKFISQVTGQDYNYYENETKGRYRINFYNRDNQIQLARFGIVPNKTYTLTVPPLKEKEYRFLPYIIRGIIDGDGCIGNTSYGEPYFSIATQSENFKNWLVEMLETKLYMNNINTYVNENGLWEVMSANQRNIRILDTLIYDKPYGMARKYNKLKKMFRDYNKDNLV